MEPKVMPLETKELLVKNPSPDLEWANLLKSKPVKNPFLAPKPLYQPLKNTGCAFLGSVGAIIFNKIMTDNLPDKWHLPVHGIGATLTILMPSHPISAGLGGAMFYALINETYEKFIKAKS